MPEFKAWDYEYVWGTATCEGCFCSGCMDNDKCEFSWAEERLVRVWMPAEDFDILAFYTLQEAFALGNMPSEVRPRMKPPEARFEYDYFSEARTFLKREERRMERRNAKWEIEEAA